MLTSISSGRALTPRRLLRVAAPLGLLAGLSGCALDAVNPGPIKAEALNSPSALLPLSLIKSAESSIPFDLTNGPLFRLHLVKRSAERHELLFTAHHLVCDGWSFGMILAELEIGRAHV